MKNKKLLYKIVSALTLALPVSITLVVSAIWSKPTPDLVVLFDSVEVVQKVEDLERHFVIEIRNEKLYIDNSKGATNVSYLNIDFTPNEKAKNEFGIKSIEMKKTAYIRFITDDFDKVVEKDGKLQAVSNINIQTGNKLSLAFIISVVATLIVVAIISGKMEFQKKYPKTAVFIALLSGTIILYVIDMIIGSMLTVFVVATISWGLYCIENYYFYNTIETIDKNNRSRESELIEALRKAL